MRDNQAPIKEGPNEILQRIQAKNERLSTINFFADKIDCLNYSITRHDLLALDDENLKAVVQLMCDHVPNCSYLQEAEQRLGADWVDVDLMRKALAAHKDKQHYFYLKS